MNTTFGFSLVGAGRAGHDPQRLAWSPQLIDPAGQCTANPIMPCSCRGVGMTGSPPGPAPSRDPGPDERTAHPF
jgi:hypothetical protein